MDHSLFGVEEVSFPFRELKNSISYGAARSGSKPLPYDTLFE